VSSIAQIKGASAPDRFHRRQALGFAARGADGRRGRLSRLQALNWYAYLGPARLPKDLVDRLKPRARQALGAPECRRHSTSRASERSPATPEELARYIARETRLGKVVKEAGIQAQ